jgi:ankyrin repeat protein
MTSNDEYNFILTAPLNEIKDYIQYFDDETRNNNILVRNAQYGRFEIVEHMVRSGHIHKEIPLASPDSLSNAIINAAYNGYLHIVRYLVIHGWDPRVSDDLPFRNSAINGHLDVVKYLVSLGVDASRNENYALHMSAAYGHINIVKYLIEDLKCDPKCLDNRPLKNAAECGC